LRFEIDGDVVWVDLVQFDTGAAIPKYGRGDRSPLRRSEPSLTGSRNRSFSKRPAASALGHRRLSQLDLDGSEHKLDVCAMTTRREQVNDPNSSIKR
jgi:hypothetical protein